MLVLILPVQNQQNVWDNYKNKQNNATGLDLRLTRIYANRHSCSQRKMEQDEQEKTMQVR